MGSGEMEQKESGGSASEARKEEKVAGSCPRDRNRCAAKEVARSFFLSPKALVFHQTVSLMHRA